MIIEIASWIVNLLVLGLSILVLMIGCFCGIMAIMAGRDVIRSWRNGRG